MYMTSRLTMKSAANSQSQGINQAFDEFTTQPISPLYPGFTENEASSTHCACPEGSIPLPCELPACQPGCRCHCHKPPTSIIPTSLSSLLGRMYVPQGMRSMLFQVWARCDEPRCRRQHTSLFIIKYYFPLWFRRINAEIRVESHGSVHFSLRIPRVVGKNSFHWLMGATVDEVKEKLWSRELTVNDVDPDGFTLLHVSFYYHNKAMFLFICMIAGRDS